MFDELRNFVAIAETGSFRLGAVRAHLSQPALSASIARLERRLGTKLFVRGRRGTGLSASGEFFLPKARAVLSSVRDAELSLAQFLGAHHGEVRIGGTATVCAHYLPPHLLAFRKKFPDVTLRVREATSAEVEEQFDSGELDLGFVTGSLGEPWLTDELVFVKSPRAAWPSLAACPFVTFRKGATSRELLEQRFPEANIVMELSSVESIKEHVRLGVGVALVSRIAVERELKAGALEIIPHRSAPIRRTIRIIKKHDALLAPAARVLWDSLNAGTRR